jgi:hypothetical protein
MRAAGKIKAITLEPYWSMGTSLVPCRYTLANKSQT